MAKWEYPEVSLNYQSGGSAVWYDSLGRSGELVYNGGVPQAGEMLADLGRQDWELVGVESYPDISDGSTYGSGYGHAKWIFKRPA